MEHRDNAPDLFTWKPSRPVIVFPMAKRVGRIRAVALKMLDKATDRSAAFYRDQVTESLRKQLTKAAISEAEQCDLIEQFWSAVQAEITRQCYRGQKPGGNAA
jgi:hypothetical protein